MLISSPARVKLARVPMPVYHRNLGFEAYSHFGESITIGCLNGLMLRRARFEGGSRVDRGVWGSQSNLPTVALGRSNSSLIFSLFPKVDTGTFKCNHEIAEDNLIPAQIAGLL